MEPKWFKSSRSSAGQHCVEVAFVKSSRSGQQGDCVEVGIDLKCDKVLVRDSKNPTGPVLEFTRGEWAAFIGGAVDGEFDLR